MAVKPKLAVKSRTASKPIGAAKPNKRIRSRQSEFTHLAEDIISNINVGIYIVQNRKFVYVSPLFEKLSGYSYADLTGTNPLDYLHPDDREMIRKKAIKLLKGKSSAAYEYRFTRKNGEEFWVLEMITSITYKGDRAALVSFMDITERKQMEEALRQSEEKHRTIIENIRDGYFEVDLAGNYIFFNESICEIHGYSKKEMMGTNYRQYVDKENAKKVFEAFNEIYKTGITGGIFDYEIIRKNGTKRQVEISATLQKDSSGNPIGFRGTTRDVTERRKMEETIRQSEERYRTILDEMEDAYFEVDLAGNFIFFNDAICRLLKYSKEELLGKSFRVHVDKDDVPILYNAFGKIYRTGKPERGLCYKAVRKDGTTGFAEMTGFPLQNQKGEMIGFRGIGREITQRMKLEERLRQSEEKYRTILENMQEGYFEVDLAGNITFCNDSMCRFLGYTQEEMMGINNRQFTDKKNAEKLFRAFNEVYKTGEPTKEFDWQIIRKDGTKRFIEASISLKKDSTGKSIGFQGITRDVTERKLNEEKILYMATHDTLTGLPNRLMFSQLINHAIQTAQRYQREFAVLFIDLDRFKAVNDIMGHEAGDQMLQEIATRLKQVLRAVDVAARFGGDEFVIFIEEVSDPSHVAIVAQKILTNIIKPITIMGREYRITASIGICMFPKDAEDEQSLMKNADIAMYLAKEEGKNNYQFYSENIKSKSLGRLSIETNLRWALERNELSLHYQAKVDFKTNVITGVEALLRWQSPYLGSVTPIQFIPVAEETGLILSIGRWVIRKVCEQNIAWQQQGLPGVCIAVNLSPQQLDDDHLIDDIKTALEDSGMAPSLLELEITEGMVMHNPTHTIAVLAKIKNLGVRLAIDDFGTGYSSLAQIKRFPIDTLKVDRSFVHSVVQDADGKAIIRAMIALSKTLSLTIVAEGVETEDQMNFLKEHACDEMQGYYFSKPIVPEEFADLLRKHVPYPLK
jgi:diguanylate cyclase (GGDEF)-like protein/PAS domain S-box-containing protein